MGLIMSNDYEYFQNKRPERIYISREFSNEFNSDESKPMRYISRVVDEQDIDEICEVEGEEIIRVTPKQKEEIKALFYVDSREISRLTFQRFTRETGKPHKKTSLSFSGDSIKKIYELLQTILVLDLDQNDEKIRIDENAALALLRDYGDLKKIILANPELVKEIAENEITKSDIIALAYRKRQLEEFSKLLKDEKFFTTKETEFKVNGKEHVWQKFFEINPWIFGYGLNYIFTSNILDKKLEQVVSGFNFNRSGKRVDALLQTNGLINSLCFLEIKSHKTELLQKKEYRPECWSISHELAGSISQIQKTVQKALLEIKTKTEIINPSGDLTGNDVYLYQPKAYVVIGSLEEFLGEHGVNETKYSSFELFRRNLSNPEIITYDELYERAKFIVNNADEKHMIENQENS